MQSSASLSRRKRRQQKKAPSGGGGGGGVGGSSSAGEGQEAEEASIASAAESQPLISFLEIIRSDKYGSLFRRRLESQETAIYRTTVRRHVDLEMVRAKLKRSGPASLYGAREFFRDLMLLCANAIVFYQKDSRECIAASHVRELVVKEMAAASLPPKPKAQPTQLKTTTTKTEAAPPLPAAEKPQPASSNTKTELDLAGSLLVKPTSKAPLIACRKRSSISNKAAVAAVSAKEKEEKSESNRKDKDNVDDVELVLAKKKTGKDKSFISGTTRGLRTNKSRSSMGNAGPCKRPNLALTPVVKPKPQESAAASETPSKAEKKSNGSPRGSLGGGTSSVFATKKQGAASFLNRMKRRSNGTLIESLKASSPGSGTGGKGTEQKKKGKADGGRNYQVSRQEGGGGGSAKKVEGTSGSGKRSVGRPPKRAAPPQTPPPAKRTREEAEKPEATKAASSSAARKRGRK